MSNLACFRSAPLFIRSPNQIESAVSWRLMGKFFASQRFTSINSLSPPWRHFQSKLAFQVLTHTLTLTPTLTLTIVCE